MQNPIAKTPLVASGVLIAIGFFFSILGINKPLGDFANYYFASKLFLDGSFGVWVYEPFAFNQYIQSLGYTDVFVNYAPVPPFSVLFYIPTTFFEVHTSKFLFNLSSVLIAGLSYYRLARVYSPTNWMICILPIVFVIPIKSNIYMGQSYLLLLAMIGEGILQLDKRKHLSSLLWVIPSMLKIFPALLMMYPLLKQKYTMIASFIGISILVSGVILVALPFEVIEQYIFKILPRLASNEINDTYSISYQSFTVALKHLFVYDYYSNPSPWLHNPALFKSINTFISISILLTTLWIVFKTSNTIENIGLLILTSTLISGYGTQYGLTLLIIPSIWAIHQKNHHLVILFAMVALLPAYILFNAPFPFSFMRLILLLCLWFIWARKVSVQIPYVLIIAFALFFGAIGWIVTRENKCEYIPKQIISGIMYDYVPTSTGIQVSVLGKGYSPEQHIDSIVLDQKVVFSKRVTLHDNQIFLDKVQITHTNDTKKKPALYGKDNIIYLSDMNRGYGFYALRKLPISSVSSSKTSY